MPVNMTEADRLWARFNRIDARVQQTIELLDKIRNTWPGVVPQTRFNTTNPDDSRILEEAYQILLKKAKLEL